MSVENLITSIKIDGVFHDCGKSVAIQCSNNKFYIVFSFITYVFLKGEWYLLIGFSIIH